MKSLELKGARVRRGYTQTDAAKALGISVTAYSDKETGKREFDDNQKLLLIRLLGLSLQETNDIFYDGGLPNGVLGE